MPKVTPAEQPKINNVQPQIAPRTDVTLAPLSKYEVKPEDTFKIEFYLVFKENRPIILEEAIKGFPCENHWVEFKMWTFDEEITLRKAATIYDQMKRLHIVDNDLLNKLKIQKLLKRWSFEASDPINLKLFHINGILVDESYNKFKGLFPNIVDYIINKMNGVLEYNQ